MVCYIRFFPSKPFRRLLPTILLKDEPEWSNFNNNRVSRIRNLSIADCTREICSAPTSYHMASMRLSSMTLKDLQSSPCLFFYLFIASQDGPLLNSPIISCSLRGSMSMYKRSRSFTTLKFSGVLNSLKGFHGLKTSS